MDQIVGMAQLYFMPHPLLEIVQRLMAHPVYIDRFEMLSVYLTDCLGGKDAWRPTHFSFYQIVFAFSL